ncbi:hypothetical protein ACFWTC_03220 [Streptomyces sp. NPDC058619]|uniref:hypothetical protein n=1 Tax=unclassified Streptomyces TaxID=2593676 RepID=UPI003652B87A
MGIWYATREDVQRALDSKETARNAGQIDRGLDAGSRAAERLCHRIFYPEIATRAFDWPNAQRAGASRLWLDGNELLSVSAITSGGTAISPADVLLEPAAYGPPYNRLELSLASSAAFGGGPTWQRDISITGLWAGCPVEETTSGTVVGALDATQTTVAVDGPASARLGVGGLLRVDTERMTVTERAMLATGQTLTANLDVKAASVLVTVASTAGFTAGEVVLVDGERMLIVDVAGSNLVVKRGWDGSALAAHTTGAAVYASRSLTVRRGVLGTTAAAHSAAAPVHRWEPPALIRTLAIGEALSTLGQEHSAYITTVRSSESGGERTRDLRGIAALRQQVYDAYGRMARIRGV